MISVKKLNTKVKFGKHYYQWGLFDTDDMSAAGRIRLHSIINRECPHKHFYYGFNSTIMFQNKSDADYFAMKAVFVHSEFPPKIKITNVGWNVNNSYSIQIRNPNKPLVVCNSV